MYQALYRKYRPKSFDDVIGQEVVVQTLRNSIKNEKISHAYLFAGPRGSGKTTIAKIFAKIVNCQNLKGSEPCNKCVYCTQIDGQNMDIIEMDAASNNGVDEIREINNKVNLVPSLGKYKIYIIDEVHMLTIGAFNALLKTLEEPPSHVIFILATTDPHKVPITILSRCQRFDLKKISDENIFKRLEYICQEEKIEIDDSALEEISRLGDGSLRDAISILDQVISYTNQKISLNDVHEVNGSIAQEDIKILIHELLLGNLSEILNQISFYSNKGKSIIKITEEIILYLRNSILSKTTDLIQNKNIYQEINQQLSIEQLLKYIEIMNQTLLDMKKFSNQKLFLELSFIKIIDKEGNFIEKSPIEKLDKKGFDENKMKVKVIENPLSQSTKIETKLVDINEIDIMENSNKKVNANAEEKNINISNELLFREFQNIIDLRINNALSNFSKKETIKFKEKLAKIMDYLMDEKFNSIATIILDGELKAVSDEYAVFCFTSSHLATSFNENIIDIELLLEEIYNKHYKVVAVNRDEWNQIKEDFNSKRKTFVYKKEAQDIKQILTNLQIKEEDDIKSLFGDLVEYN